MTAPPLPSPASPQPPRHAQTTTTALLDSLKDPGNSPVWEEFDARYRPILNGFARKLGLSQEDAADIAQQALTEFVRDYRAGLYARGKGRLSTWLISITRNRAIDFQRGMGRRREWRGESAFEQIPGARPPQEVQDSGNDDALWDAERKHAILALALTRLRETSRTSETTIKAFELVAIRGVPSEAVARECGITVDEVYVAKNRVTKQLREIVAQVTKVYEED
jgi:RNA polymerase sigma-70 factor (ECF subfamily)